MRAGPGIVQPTGGYSGPPCQRRRKVSYLRLIAASNGTVPEKGVIVIIEQAGGVAPSVGANVYVKNCGAGDG